MRNGRLFWAILMTAAALAAMAGYTAAVPTAQTPEAFPPVEVRAPEPEPAPEEPLLPPLLLTVRDETGGARRDWTLLDEDGTEWFVKAGQNGEYLLSLPPGRTYTMTGKNGAAVTFTFAENAAVANVAGSGWTDGEILYLSKEPRCTLRVIRSAGAEPVVYTLTGPDYEAQRALYIPPGQRSGAVVFSGLRPGDYLLTGTDGVRRAVKLTGTQPDVALGVE